MLRKLFVVLLSLALVAPTAAGQVATIGIVEFENAANVSNNAAEAISNMLVTAMAKTKKFEPLERQRLGEIFDEQNLGASGAVDYNTAAKIGRLKGVDYMLFGTVTEADVSGSGVGVRGLRFGKKTVTLAVDIRFVDSSTGSIKFTESFREEDSARDVGVGRLSFDADDPTTGRMSRAVVDAITFKCMMSVYPPKVVKYEEATGDVILNYGSILFEPGQVWKVYSQGEAYVDPDTGMTLGASETLIGEIQVADVKPNYSQARVVSGTAMQGAVCRQPGGAVIRADRSQGGDKAEAKSERRANKKKKGGIRGLFKR